jgi:hypothetical protein
MFGAGKAKKPQPATRSSTPDQPVPVGTGVVRFLVWAFSVTLKPTALLGHRGPVLAAAVTVVAAQAPAAASAQCGPTLLDLR